MSPVLRHGMKHLGNQTALRQIRSLGDMSDQSFWNSFYANRPGDKVFDWFVNFEDVFVYLEPHFHAVSFDDLVRILDIGCGTSDFSLKLFEHLNRKCRIDCVDFSFEAVKAMQKLINERELPVNKTTDLKESFLCGQHLSGMACHQADAKRLPFGDATFSLVFDKGTSDAVLKGANGESAFAEVVKECFRVLKPEGKLIQFSDEPPELRINLLESVKPQIVQHCMKENCNMTWVWRELEVCSGFQYFMYVVYKRVPISL